MAAVLDFTKFTFTAEQIRTVNELLFDDILKAPELTLLCTMYPNIVFDKEIGFIGEGGLVGKKRQNCDPVPQAWNVNTRKLVWEPKSWEILIDQCFSELESNAAVYSLHTGRDIADFIDTDYMTILLEVLSESIRKFIIRLFWFNDEDADNVTDGGFITDGIDVGYFDILNGFWKQIFLQTTANPKQLVSISENAGTSYAAQELSSTNIKSYLQQLVFKAPILLRNRANTVIACTQSFYDAYNLSLQGTALETMYANLVNGQKTLTYNGIPLIPVPFWDETIGAFENSGDKLHAPHRAVYLHKDLFAAGVDGDDSFDKLETWYNKDTRKVRTEAMGKADAKILNPELFMAAF